MTFSESGTDGRRNECIRAGFGGKANSQRQTGRVQRTDSESFLWGDAEIVVGWAENQQK